MDQAGADNPNPDSTREAVGGIAETAKPDGTPSGDFVAYSTVRPDATPGEGGKPPTAKEIAQATGGAPVAGIYSHQLAGRTHGQQEAQGASPSTADKEAMKGTQLPQLVITRTQTTMAWTDDKGKVQTGVVMTYKDINALKRGNVSVVTPKQLKQ